MNNFLGGVLKSKTFLIRLTAVLIMIGGFFVAANANAVITTINLVSPDGGQEWRGTQNITWNGVSDNASDAIDILYAADGVNFNQVVAQNRLFSDGSYSWNTTLSFPDSLTARIQISPNGFPLPSDSSANVFTLDNTAPVTTFAISPVSPDGIDGWYVSTPTITLTCDDGAGSGCNDTYYKWDGAASWTTYSVPFLALEGEHVLSFYSDDNATDAVGMRNEEVVQTQTIKVDTVFPTVIVTSITPDGAYNEGDAINVTLTFSEAVSSTDALTVTLDTGGTCVVPALTDATTGACSYTVGVGQNSPDLTVASITPNSGVVEDIAGNNSTLVPTANIADTSAIVIDTTFPTVFTVGTVVTTGGTEVTGWWNATNTGVNVTVPVDNDASLTGGTIQLQAEADGTWVNIGVAYTILSGELGNDVVISLTAPEFEGITDFSEGDNVQFRAVISDIAGNSTTGTESADNLDVDQTAPTVDAGTDKEVNAQVAQDAATSDGGSNLDTHQWSQEGGSGVLTFGTDTMVDTTIEADDDDTYVARLTVTDVAGNSAFDEIQFAWDTIAPVLAEVTPVPTPTNDTTPDYTFSADSVKQLAASVGGAITYGGTCSSAATNATAGSNTITFNALADGIYDTCTIAVTDAAGNLSLVLPVTEFEIDTIVATVLSITTTDANLDGQVDTVTIVFTDEVKDSSFSAGTFMIGSVAATNFSTGGTPDDDTIVLSHAGVAGTEAKLVTYTPGTAADLAGNALGAISQTSTDAAGPVLLSARTVTTTSIEATFSEDLNGTTVNPSGNEFAVTGFAVSNADETAPGIVTLTVATMLTDATPDVTFTNTGTFTDLAAVPNEAVSPVTVTAVDGVAAVLTTVSISSNNAKDGTLWAKEGDMVTVSFTASEQLHTNTAVIIGNESAIVTDLGTNNWTATLVMDDDDVEGVITFLITFEDVATPVHNVGVPVIDVTDATEIFYDRTNPDVDAGLDREVNAEVSPQGATASDAGSGVDTYGWEAVGPGTITYSNQSGTGTGVDTDISADIDGTYTITLTVEDEAGNIATDEMIWL